ncbi:uncharacterized protein LOC133818951 [Humulus lupulus]|uniref:uncharacterized protein LOC133818951 n=1 Tax=Humulus lupulus TaxID=3486 RepID=UPI002B4096DA|nr:uncharacterized protein LOC133818951 [Humulus lupulus]
MDLTETSMRYMVVSLEKNPLPTSKRVMMGFPLAAETEQSALAARRPNNGDDSRGTRRDRPWCTHCSKVGHTKETCWKIHGKPADWKPRSSIRNNSDSQALTAAPTKAFPFSPAQITQLHQLLSTTTNASASDPSSTSTQGTSAAFNAQKSAWIVDSGASDHMTGQSSHFTTYTPCPGYVLGEDDWECKGM